MMKELMIHANSATQAVTQACEQLGKTKEEITFVVIKEAKKSLFGKIKEQAQIKITYEEQETVDVVLNATEAKIQAAQKYLDEVLTAMGLVDIEQIVDRENESDNVKIALKGENLGMAIGRRGETLDALQYLVSLVANRIEGDYVRFIIDSGNFREKREETLRVLAGKIARTTLKTGRNSTLEPMNPYERRIIHSVVSEVAGVYSKSVGEEPNRKVVVFSETPRKITPSRPKEERNTKPKQIQNKNNNKPAPRKYDKDYVPQNVSNKPSTYDFEKEFLKSGKNGTKLN